jgi:glutathione S-transferase
MKLTLYYAPIACSLVPLVTLHESGADFEVKPISLRNKQQYDAEYLRINPKSKVPVLVIDGEPLTENVAILTWLANAFPARKLLPREPKNSIKALSLMAWCASGIHPHLARINAPARFCDVSGTEESIRRLATYEVLKAFKLADAMLAGREWVFDHWTAVDAYLFWIWRRAGQFKLDVSAFPNYAAHGERMTERESVKRALAFERDVQAQAEKAA